MLWNRHYTTRLPRHYLNIVATLPQHRESMKSLTLWQHCLNLCKCISVGGLPKYDVDTMLYARCRIVLFPVFPQHYYNIIGTHWESIIYSPFQNCDSNPLCMRISINKDSNVIFLSAQLFQMMWLRDFENRDSKIIH